MTDELDDVEFQEIDWENPFDDIRSSEIADIKLKFENNGRKAIREDDKGVEYTQFKFDVIRMDISNPSAVSYTTSSKRLIDEFAEHAPIKGKILQIVKSGTGFQTKYKVTEVKK